MINRKLILIALSATIAAGAFGGVAMARQQHKGMMPPMARPAMYVFMLKNFDADKNGQISAEEAKTGAGNLFTLIDTDKDGAATPKELRAWHEARMTAMKATMKPGAEADMMDDADAGPDGDMAPAETGGKKGFRHHGMAGHRMMGGPGMMRMLDADENGQVSKAEAETAVDGLFKRMDTNADGTVSIDDFPG